MGSLPFTRKKTSPWLVLIGAGEGNAGGYAAVLALAGQTEPSDGFAPLHP